MMMDGTFVIEGKVKTPKWCRTFVRIDGVAYVPPVLGGMSSAHAFFCCSFDGEPMVSNPYKDGEMLVPIDWLIDNAIDKSDESMAFLGRVRDREQDPDRAPRRAC